MLTVIAWRTTCGSGLFSRFSMAFNPSFGPLRWFWTWSQRSIINPQSSDVFFASVTFSVKISYLWANSHFEIVLWGLTDNGVEGIRGGEDPHFGSLCFYNTEMFLSRKIFFCSKWHEGIENEPIQLFCLASRFFSTLNPHFML